jgi:hypothetical protein
MFCYTRSCLFQPIPPTQPFPNCWICPCFSSSRSNPCIFCSFRTLFTLPTPRNACKPPGINRFHTLPINMGGVRGSETQAKVSPSGLLPAFRVPRPLSLRGSPPAQINRTTQARCRPIGTSGRERRRTPEASKMALPMAGATAMMGVSPAPAGARSFRSIRMASISGKSWKRGTR